MTDFQALQAIFWFMIGFYGVALSIGLLDWIDRRFIRDHKKNK